jgi:predicted nucleotidyltransferase
MPFPAARAAALEHFFRKEPGKNKEGLVLRYPSAPNDILGVEYCRALIHSGSSIQPHAISRIDVPTATQYRQDILADRSIPIADAKIIPRTSVTQVPLFPLHPDDFSDQLMYALRMQEEKLDSFVDITPELAIRIRKQLGSYSGFTAFCDLVNTRSLAAFLFNEMERLKAKETTPQEAIAQAKLASQLNNLLDYELKRTVVQMKLKEAGANVEVKLREIESKSFDDATVE